MKILFSIIIVICVVEYHRTTSCNTSGDCASNCDCNSCAKSNCCSGCQTQCQGCRTNCCNNNSCSCCSKCCNNTTTTTTTTTTTSKTPTTLTTSKPTQPTTPTTTTTPSVDESNININIKNVMNTTTDVKIPIEISLKNVNNIVNLLNMTGNSNCTVRKGCNRTTTPKPVIATTITPVIRKVTTEKPLTDEDKSTTPEIATLDPTWVRILVSKPDDAMPDGPVYAQPIPYSQLQNIYDQNPPIGVDYNQLSRVQSGYPYSGSNYDQFSGFPYGSSYPTQGFPFGSWPGQEFPYGTLRG